MWVWICANEPSHAATLLFFGWAVAEWQCLCVSCIRTVQRHVQVCVDCCCFRTCIQAHIDMAVKAERQYNYHLVKSCWSTNARQHQPHTVWLWLYCFYVFFFFCDFLRQATMWERIEFRTMNRCRAQSKFTNSFIEIRCVLLYLNQFFVRKKTQKFIAHSWNNRCLGHAKNRNNNMRQISRFVSSIYISFETRSEYHLCNEQVPRKFCSGFSLLFLRFHRKLDLSMRCSKSNCKSQPFIYVFEFIHFTSNYFRSRSHREHLWSYWSARCATQNVTIHDHIAAVFFFFFLSVQLQSIKWVIAMRSSFVTNYFNKTILVGWQSGSPFIFTFIEN